MEIWRFSFDICYRNHIWNWEVVKKIHKYSYLRIFHLITSWSRILIPKAYLKWERPYIYYKKFFKSLANTLKSQKIDFPFYFQISLGQWSGVILEIPYGCFRVFCPFFPRINTAWLVLSSDLKMDPLNLYPT